MLRFFSIRPLVLIPLLCALLLGGCGTTTGGPVSLQGRVSRNGTVQVSVAAGEQRADGSGRLFRDHGGGFWRGQGSAGTCAGRWEAERRG